ncbi:hypothetical protein [Leptospira perdikensis]|uniref:Lipoprotein n=1 Tax=Leptospira perdikensis TaxID=2484948 RepID=A0A4R9JE56_9LEPT|nr:hypothetical protein [Leptospira perdikensis]TGL37862.1 hypothetical protein EHQ49_15330 [Leptospira perdikensis]
MYRFPKLFFFYTICFFSCFSFACQLTKEKLQSAETLPLSDVSVRETACPIPLTKGVVYGTTLTKFDETCLLAELKVLLADLCAGSFSHLPNLVHPTKGLYVDAKGYWTYVEVKKDLADPNGYFQVYYFDSKKLDEKKGSVGNLTVREVFLSAKQVWVDFYAGSSEEVEVKFRFLENPKLERYLINPSFVKEDGKWYLLRMF